MKASRKDEWQAEARMYETIYRTVTKRKTKIIEIPPRENELGYTASDGYIHLARRHPIMGGLKEDEKQFFRMGVFAHEMCHQLFTDFDYLEETLKKHPWNIHQQVIGLFANLVEDPAIEYEAETKFGGDLLAALRFSISYIYSTSPKIDESDEAFTQLCNALIQFGDMGILKGHFTSKEAFDYFKKIAPEFNTAVTETDPQNRIDYAVRWADMTRPLWEKDTEEEEQQFLQGLKGIMDDNSISQSSGTGMTPEKPESSDNKSDVSERRSAIIKKLQEEHSDENEDNSESEGNGQETQTQEQATNDAGQGADKSAEGTEESNNANETNKDGSKKQKQKTEDTDNSDAGEHSQDEGTGSASWDPLSEFETEDDGKDIFEKEKKKMDKDMLKQVRTTIEEGAKGIAKRRKQEEINISTEAGKYTHISCKNEVMTVDKNSRNAYQAEYTEVLKSHAKDIRLLTSSLKKIFQQDVGENVRSLSGRYNVVRASKQSTAKIFDRRKLPKNIDDLAVMLLIDESGSMSYNRKADIARETAIILAEAFASLNIPCYIMGFTTGTAYDAVHHHYVSWKNTKEERLSLAGISASSSNFDGYSIRNATSILKKKPAEHKILFVISDGYPACRRYSSLSEGVADTATAIKEAKQIATVLGIGIGDCSPEILKHMYKGSFVHAKEIQSLSVTLTNNLKKILKKY